MLIDKRQSTYLVFTNDGLLWTIACQAPLSMEFSRQDTGVGCHCVLQGIFSTQESNLRLLHWQAVFTPELSGKPFQLMMALVITECYWKTDSNSLIFVLNQRTMFVYLRFFSWGCQKHRFFQHALFTVLCASTEAPCQEVATEASGKTCKWTLVYSLEPPLCLCASAGGCP